MKLKFALLIIIVISSLLIPNSKIYAQSDNLSEKPEIKNEYESEYNQIEALQSQQMMDSLKKNELELQLNSSVNSKRVFILESLDSLNAVRTNRIKEISEIINQLKLSFRGYPVMLGSDTVFRIYAGLGVMKASRRAEMVSARLLKLSEEVFFSPESLKVNSYEPFMYIAYGENILFTITKDDALWANTTPKLLADNCLRSILASVEKYREETSWKYILREIALTLIVFSVLAVIFFLISKLFAKIFTRIELERDRRIKAIKIKNYELINSVSQIKIVKLIITVIKWIVIILFIYISLLALFSIYPGTKPFAEQMISLILSPLTNIGSAVWKYIPNLITIIVIMIVFRLVLKLIKYFKREIETGALTIPGFYADWANPTFQIVRVIVLSFMLVVIFPYLPGSDSPVFQGISVFLGVLFTFGSSGPLSNLIAGIVLTYMRAFRVGDFISIGEIKGVIQEKSALVIRMRTIKNEIISIPNSVVMGSNTTNFSTEAGKTGLIIHTSVTIGYDAEWRKVHELLINAALSTEHILKTPEPFVLQTSLDDFYVSYEINAYTKEDKKIASIYSHLHQNIQDKFNEGGVEIMSPHYKSLRDGNTIAIPEKYHPDGYEKPAFDIRRKE